ncbi:MAG: GGDEF domain-containing protein [bacterium]
MKDSIADVISLCRELDEKAYYIYNNMADIFESNESVYFWKKMADRKTEHIRCWTNLLELEEENLLPSFYADYKDTCKYLEDQISKTQGLIEHINDLTPDMYLIIICHLEFYLLNTDIQSFLHFVNNIPLLEFPVIDYEKHLNELLDGIVKHSGEYMEMELMGETIRMLWSRNRVLDNESKIDELTGIHNRRGFFNLIKPVLEMGENNKARGGIVMIDIDNFKHLNDTYGHTEGDRILKKVSEAIRSSIRTCDFASRYGGDEFIVYIVPADRGLVLDIAENIRTKVYSSFNKTTGATVSIGYYAGDGYLTNKNINEWTKRADSALYRAKRSGKNLTLSY